MPHSVPRPLDLDARIQAFDLSYPNWRAVVQGGRQPFNRVRHEAFKHRYRSEIYERRNRTSGCDLCGKPGPLVADPSPDQRLRGLLHRTCRHRLTSVPVSVVSLMPAFTLDYCPVWCRRNYPSICEEHLRLSTWWLDAGSYLFRFDHPDPEPYVPPANRSRRAKTGPVRKKARPVVLCLHCNLSAADYDNQRCRVAKNGLHDPPA